MSEDIRKGLPSASGFARLALCPGSFALEQQCPDVPSDAAEEGTFLHACMEKLIYGEVWDGAPLTAGQEELCDRALRLLDGVKERVREDCNNRGVLGDGEEVSFRVLSTEERQFIHDWIDDCGYSGQWDALLEVKCGLEHFMLVLDWKFGRVEVEAAEANRQLEALVPLVDEWCCNNGMKHDGVYAAIIQPRVAGASSVAFYYPDDVERAKERSMGVARAAMDQHAPRFCSEEACRYCRAKAVCHEVAATVESAALITTDREKWEVFSPEEKVKAYRLAKLAGKWKAAVEFRFEQDVVAGLIPGFEMGAGRTSFTVVDAAGAFGVLNAEFPDGMTAEAFTRCCKVGITDLDCLVHDLRKAVDPKATVKSSREWLRERLAGVGEEKTTKGSVKEIEGGAV